MITIKLNTNRDIPENFTGIIEYSNGTKVWCKEGKYHREDGPAIEFADGGKEWWIEGIQHRIDGPATIYPNGQKEWWVDDRWYLFIEIDVLVKTSIYLGKEKGKYGFEWLTFLTSKRIEKFPIVPGMEEDKSFKPPFNQLFGTPSKP